MDDNALIQALLDFISLRPVETGFLAILVLLMVWLIMDTRRLNDEIRRDTNGRRKR